MKESEQTTQEVQKAPHFSRKCLYPAAFFAVGIMLITFGFWKTLFVALLTAVGAFLGSTDNVEESAKKAVNKLFPPTQKKVTYSAEDMEKLKKALEKKESRETAQPAETREPEEKA